MMAQKSTLKHILALTISIMIIFGVSSLSYGQQNGLNFDGVDDYAMVSNASGTIVGGTGISMSCWVYPVNANSGYPNFDGFCGFRNDSDADFYLLQLNSTNLEARFRNSSGVVYTLSYSGFQLNTWQHYVLTHDGTTLKLYKDNVMVQSLAATGSISNSIQPFYVGKLPFQSNNFQFMGTLDEVGLYNKALSTTEISSLYTCGIQPPATNVKLHYKFNQGIAGGTNTGLTTATNSAGSLNATLLNFSLSGATSNWVVGKPIGNFNYLSASICEGGSYLFNGQTLTIAGVYSDTIAVVNSCDSIIVLNLDVNPGFYDTTNTTICAGESVSFHGTTYSATGQYSEIYSTALCDSIYTLNLTVDPIPSAFSITGESIVGIASIKAYSVPANASLTYTWSVFNGQILTYPSNDSVYVQWGSLGPASVSAFAVNQNACKGDTVVYNVSVSDVGIDEASIKDLIDIFPNPVSTSFIVKTDLPIILRIYDVEGKEVFITSQKEVNIAHLQSGMYFIKIEDMDGKAISRSKLIKK